jgi:NAD(P)-dependent dehydrogenase (short-subunit alcohol dehydrogenase family)
MSILDEFRLDGQTAVITGGNRGIGRSIANAYADVGANIVVANRDEEAGENAASEIAESYGVETRQVSVDVSEEAEVRELAESVTDEFGQIDVLVNNAGVTNNTAAENLTLDEWNRVLDINLTGTFLCSRYIGEQMIEDGGGGTIVNISSIAAYIASNPQPQIAYHTSKGGVKQFTKQLASEWAEYDIRVNAIAPGYIRTEMVDEVLRTDDELASTWRSEMLQDEIMGPDCLKGAAVLLASDAGRYMTGETIVVDGGYLAR